jgi:hypothetical protein
MCSLRCVVSGKHLFSRSRNPDVDARNRCQHGNLQHSERLVLGDLPVREPSSLISLARVTSATADGSFSLPMYRAIAERQQSLSALIGWTSNSIINIEVDDVRTRGNVSAVTGNYFTELGIRPVTGRLLTDADVSVVTQHSARIAVIGHAFWQRQFNLDSAAVGRTSGTNARLTTIVEMQSQVR